MNKFIAITIAVLVAVVAVVSASGYGQGGYGGSYQAPSYGNNYDRKTGFKTTIYHPYGGVSNRFDYRTYPASSYGSSYGSAAPYIKTGLEYTIGDNGYGNQYGNQY